ncbi:MAG: UDP-N-acetylmuramoyl-tripeptide--D-alanyl-D-alanine ligase [Patescibacteria group bacterium]
MKNTFKNIIYKVLKKNARRVIVEHDPFVIAVTGSVGKTSTKEAIYQVLSDQYGADVRKNYGNLNTEIGLPLTILGYEKVPSRILWPIFLVSAYFKPVFIKKYPKYLILEMGVEKEGDIEYLTGIVQPDIAIITSVSGAHLENFSDLSQYQNEKISIIKDIKDNGTVFVNADDPELDKIESAQKIGINKSNVDYHGEIINLGIDGTEIRISCTGHKISVKSKLLGAQLAYSSLFAFAVASWMKISLLKVGKSLEKIKPVPGRMNYIEGEGNIKIIDDTYNSNPQSAKYAIDFMDALKYSGRKVIIFGSMNELGGESESHHLEVAKYAKGKVDMAIFCGDNAKKQVETFGESGTAFPNRKELTSKIKTLLKENDLVLIKASQNRNFFEEVVKVLMKDKNKAKELLVRQNKIWISKKDKKGA